VLDFVRMWSCIFFVVSVSFVLIVHKLHYRLAKIESHSLLMKTTLNSTVQTLVETVHETTQTFYENLETLSEPLHQIGYHVDNIIKDYKQRLDELEIWRSYLLQMNRALTSDNDVVNVCISRKKDYNHFKLGCFVDLFCDNFISIETELIQINTLEINSCLPVFYRLKRLVVNDVSRSIPLVLSNSFVQELHLKNSEDLDLNGFTEQMPQLHTLIFENCKNIFLDQIMNSSHAIRNIHAINTPCLIQYKEKLNKKGIALYIK